MEVALPETDLEFSCCFCSRAETKNPYDEANKGIVSGILRLFALQDDSFYGGFEKSIFKI